MPLDIEDSTALREYLVVIGRIGRDEPVTIRNLAGGVSNRTVLVERPASMGGEAWVLKQALPKLRVAVDWFCDPARIEREALGLRWLEKLAPPGTITPLVFEDPEHHLLAMAAVPQPHENLKDLLLAGKLNRTTLQEYATQFGRLLGTIHNRSFLQRDELSTVFADRSFFEALRIEPYYTFTARQVPGSARFYRRLTDDTRGRLLTLVHGDYSPKNILVRDGRLVLLDHEVIHWGDPAFDVGFGLTHLLSKAHHLPERRDDLELAAFAYGSAYYNAIEEDPRWTHDLERPIIRHTLGCLLARACGRSPLEYLGDEERKRQRDVVVAMMRNVPTKLGDLIGDFVAKVSM
jgi:aminoglycoside phosphotransferase (APT) family kinase protein